MSSCDDHQLDHFFNVSTNYIIDSSDHSRLAGEDSSRETFVFDDHSCHQSVLNEWTNEDALSSQLWTHVVSDGPSNIGEFGNNKEDDFNLVDASLWNNNNNTALISPEVIFEPVYDYHTKMNNDWEFPTSSSSSDKNSTLRKQVNELTNLVGNWSMSPSPHHDPEINPGFDHILPCNDFNQFDPYNSYEQLLDDHANMKSEIEDWEFPTSSSSSDKNITLRKHVNELTNLVGNWSMSPPPHHEPAINPGFDHILPCNDFNQFDPYNSYEQLLDDHANMKSEIEDLGSMVKSSFGFSDLTYDIGLTSKNIHVAGDYCSKCYYGISTLFDAKNLGHSVDFNGRLCKAPKDNIKTGARSSGSLDRGKQVLQLPRQVGKWHGAQNNEGKKKRIFEEASPTSVKKPKKESSIAVKKCREKVNALHQIVSPYGKTDEASVLSETIQHIKSLQGEVQVLSNPYMKNLHKNQWPRSLEIIEKRDHATKVDLKSWGLALVPISCLPQEYQDSGEFDYWTPTYTSCLYR